MKWWKLQWDTISHHSEWPSSINQQTTSADEDVEKGEPSCTVGGNADWCSHCGNEYGVTSKKMDLPFDPAIPLLGIHSKEPRTLIRKNISTPVFIAALFTISKRCKQLKCPSVDEWIKQLGRIYTIEFYWAIKKKKLLPICYSMDGPGEPYVKGNKTFRQRQMPCDFPHMWNLMNKLN